MIPDTNNADADQNAADPGPSVPRPDKPRGVVRVRGSDRAAAARRRAFGQLLSVVIVVAAVSVHVHFASTRSVRKASRARGRDRPAGSRDGSGGCFDAGTDRGSAGASRPRAGSRARPRRGRTR